MRVAKNGTEATHATFMPLVRQSMTIGALTLRFQPDLVAANPAIGEPMFVDGKAGTSIEKLAWQSYGRLAAMGNKIVVVFGGWSPWRWNFFEQIELELAAATVARFRPEDRWSIVDGWICPRESPRWETQKWDTPEASGTPHRQVFGRTLRLWKEFEELFGPKSREPVIQQASFWKD